jgi:hypothetical protein
MYPSVLRYGQSIDAIILGMRPDELHEGHLSAEVESDHQAVVSSRNFEPDALAVQHFGFRSCSLDLIRRGPMRGSDEFVPTSPWDGNEYSPNDEAVWTMKYAKRASG